MVVAWCCLHIQHKAHACVCQSPAIGWPTIGHVLPSYESDELMSAVGGRSSLPDIGKHKHNLVEAQLLAVDEK
jgi:hypothetical protein